MKQLILLLLFLIPFSAKTQCSAIAVNTFVLKPLGNCRYVIEINATLSNGNASIKPFYSCGNVQITLPDCFSWANPSTQTFVTDTFVCCATVFAGIRGHASPNCNGSQCLEVQLTNLPIKISNFNAYRSDDQVCLTWKSLNAEDDDQYYIENSFDGQKFETTDFFYSSQLRSGGGLYNICVYDGLLSKYYRIRMISNGDTIFSAIKAVRSKQNDLEYNTLTRVLTILGPFDDFTPTLLTVYSRDGRQVTRDSLRTNVCTLPTLTPGIYFAVVTTPKGNLIKTLIL